MSDVNITDEAAFCRALGINPDHVMAGTVKVEMTGGGARLTFTSVYAVPPRALGAAFMAAAPAVTLPEDDEPKKAPAKKAAAKKTTTRSKS